MGAEAAGALIIASDQFYFGRMREIAMLAGRQGIAAIGPIREFAVEGGLMSYGTNIGEPIAKAGVYVGRILKGERPADLPVLRPTKFDLVLNLKAAKALAIEISPKLLALADEVIE
jgi:putative ABC transport system substrate-binding protein